MTEIQFVQEAGIGGCHMGDSRSRATRRELRALTRYLRENSLFEMATASERWLGYIEMLEDRQMPFGV